MSANPYAGSFEGVFREAKDLLKISFQDAAARVGVSKKTLETWLKRPPNAHRRRAIVDAFPELPRELRVRLAKSLDVPLIEASAKPDSALLRGALEGALFEAAETLNAPARDVRKAFGVLLARVAGLGIDVATASALLAAPRRE
jgi:hypothetical protein